MNRFIFRPFLKLLCWSLEAICPLFHWIPGYNCFLANWSAQLDEAFDLMVWKKIDPEEYFK